MNEKELYSFGYGFFLGLMWAGFPIILLGHPYIGAIVAVVAAILSKFCHHVLTQIGKK